MPLIIFEEWLTGLGINLASTGVWEAVRHAYELCKTRQQDRQSIEQLVAVASQKALLKAGRRHRDIDTKFWDAFCRELVAGWEPWQLLDVLLGAKAVECLRISRAWANALKTIQVTDAETGPQQEIPSLNVWVTMAREELLSMAAVNEKTFRRAVLRLLVTGRDKKLITSQVLEHLQEDHASIVALTAHLWRVDFTDIELPLAAERDNRRKNILSGAEPTWADIAAGLDEPRELYSGLWPRLLQIDGPTYVPIVAGSGEGKTTFLKRLAYNLWQAGKLVYFVSGRSVMDGGLVEGLRLLASRAPETVWVLVDDMDTVGAQVYAACLSALADGGKPCCLVGTMDKSQWAQRRLLHLAQIDIVLQSAVSGFPYELALGDEESKNFVEALIDAALYKKTIAPLPPVENNSLLGFLNLLAGGEKLTARLKRQLSLLSPVEVETVRTLAICHRLGTMVSIDVLECLNPGAATTLTGLVSKGIVCQTPQGCSLTHTSMALVAMEIFFRNDADLVDAMCRLLENAGPVHAPQVLFLLFRFQELWPGTVREVLLRQWSDIRRRFLPAADANQLGIHWGPLLARAELWPEAEEVFQYSLALKEQAGVLNNYANLLRLMGRGDQALPVVRRSLELAPDSGTLLANYAWLLLTLSGGADAAEPWAEKALNAADHDGFAHYVHGLILQARGDHSAALADFHAAVLHHPLEDDFWVAYGDSLVASGNLDGALEAFTLAGKICPRRADFTWRQARVLARQGNYPAAAERYAVAAGRLPDEPEVLLEWASVCLQPEHYQPATAWKVCRSLFACREQLARLGIEAEAVKTILCAAAGLGRASVVCGNDEEGKRMLVWALDAVDAARKKLKPQKLFEQYGVVYQDSLPPEWPT